jgi:cytidylate kinase
MAILSISREYGSGGREIGKAVARAADYDFVDKDHILKDLKAAGKKWQHLEEFDEVQPTIWEKYDTEYRGFIALIESTILEYAVRDRVVILGRGGNFLLGDIPHLLKVRLIAPLEVRIERTMHKNELDRKTAQWLIEKTDRSRAGYIQAIYGKNWEDMEHYDLTFNTGIQSFEEVTEILVEKLKTWDQRVSAEGRQRLANLALVAKLKARLLTDPKLFIPTLNIFHDGQAIVIQGVVHNPKELHLVEETARQIAGPHPIRNELHYRT